MHMALNVSDRVSTLRLAELLIQVRLNLNSSAHSRLGLSRHSSSERCRGERMSCAS